MDLGIALAIGALMASKSSSFGKRTESGDKLSEVPAQKVALSNSRRKGGGYLDADTRAYHYAFDDQVARGVKLNFMPKTQAIYPDHSQRYLLAVDPNKINKDHDRLRLHFTKEGLMTEMPVHTFKKSHLTHRGVPTEANRVTPHAPFMRTIFA